MPAFGSFALLFALALSANNSCVAGALQVRGPLVWSGGVVVVVGRI